MSNIFLDGQLNLLVLISAFIIGGIFKSKTLFLPLFIAATTKIKSKRFVLFLISLISGILPVEGRVSVSAPILDSLVRKYDLTETELEQKRSKLGILDYVATHHYYLWSPIEKSIILLMAGLGLTYAEVLSYTVLPLIAYICFLIFIVFYYVDESDVEYRLMTPTPWNYLMLFNIVPFIMGIGFSIFYPPYYVFPIVAVFYILKNKIKITECFKFINWKAVGAVAFIIMLSNLVKANNEIIITSLKDVFYFTNNNFIAAGSAVLIGGITAFILGSSSKYAGICVALTLTFGLKYFPLILMVEYTAYLISPTHKCLAISMTYFKTDIKEFYKYIGILCILMITCGVVLVL